MPRLARGLAVVLAILVPCVLPSLATGQTPAPAVPAGAPRPGASSIGDPLYPAAGNGGYDVQRYDLALDVDVERGVIRQATARIEAVAVHSLSRFNLDLRGLDVESVAVDGVLAQWIHDDAELEIIPAAPIADGEAFTVAVSYSGDPGSNGVADRYQRGWLTADGTVYIAGEPGGAENWFPANNHPEDAAAFTLRITVPAGTNVVAGGDLVAEISEGGRSTFVYANDDEIPPYLATFAAGDFDVRTWDEYVDDRAVHVTYAFPQDATEREWAAVANTAEMLRYFSGLFGPFPSDRIGGVVVDGFGAALETEEMVVYGRSALEERTVAHEIAHHWFGNSVRLRRWSDIWLNEGIARYAEALWAEHTGGPAARDRVLSDLAAALERTSSNPAHAFAIGNPAAGDLFSGAIYNRGALAMHALRAELSDDAFFRLLQEWHARNAGRAVTTAEFVDLAEEIAGRDLGAFFGRWLFESALPDPLLPEASDLATPVAATPVPGHDAQGLTRFNWHRLATLRPPDGVQASERPSSGDGHGGRLPGRFG